MHNPTEQLELDDWQHLLAYGYAHGHYMGVCRVCGETKIDLDKRASSCRPCAEKRYGEAVTATLVEVGREMVNITTTVHDVEEWPAIPTLWLMCMQERDAALASLVALKATHAEALRLADAIDPLTRKQAPDHLTVGAAAQALRTLASHKPPANQHHA